jgi:hypothetical protein
VLLAVSPTETLLPKNLFTPHDRNSYGGNGSGGHPFLDVLPENNEIQRSLWFLSGHCLAVQESWD